MPPLFNDPLTFAYHFEGNEDLLKAGTDLKLAAVTGACQNACDAILNSNLPAARQHALLKVLRYDWARVMLPIVKVQLEYEEKELRKETELCN